MLNCLLDATGAITLCLSDIPVYLLVCTSIRSRIDLAALWNNFLTVYGKLSISEEENFLRAVISEHLSYSFAYIHSIKFVLFSLQFLKQVQLIREILRNQSEMADPHHLTIKRSVFAHFISTNFPDEWLTVITWKLFISWLVKS